MGQRNLPCTSQMMELEMDEQSQGHPLPEPSAIFGNVTSFSQPNIHTILPAPGNAHGFDVHHLTAHQDNAVFYGMTPFNGVQHHHPSSNLDLAIATTSHYHNPYITPSNGPRVLPVLINHGSHDQLPSSSNNGIVRVSADSYGRSNHFVDGVRGSFKRKNAESIPGNFQYCSASAGSSSSVVCINPRPLESDVTSVDATSLAHPEYRGNDMSSVMEVGPHRSVRNRSGAIGVDSVSAYNSNHLIQGNYMAQPFQTTTMPWLDQRFGNNNVDGGALTWNRVPALPYPPGSINGSCMEAGNMCLQGYQVLPGNRSSTSFVHPPFHQGHPNLHHGLPLPMQGPRGHNIDFHPQVASSSRRLSTNNAHTNIHPFQEAMDTAPRVFGPFAPSGVRMYCPRRDVMLEATARQRNLPHLRVLPEDGVALLEISGYQDIGDSVDHHRDMRLDIDHMSYEELLELGEQIGSVGSGLSEETIISHLKTRVFVSSMACYNLEEFAPGDQKVDFCVICQTDYKDQEQIGTLDCKHEYHVDCIKKWLVVKNTCPICKSSALNTDKRGS